MNKFYFKPREISIDIKSIYTNDNKRETLMSILDSASEIESWLLSLRKELTCDDVEELDKWDTEFENMQQRYQEYFSAIDGAEDDSEIQKYVIAPMFSGKYPGELELSSPPRSPDSETPWRLANQLVHISNDDRLRTRCFIEITKGDMVSGLSDYYRDLYRTISKSDQIQLAPGSYEEDIDKEIDKRAKKYIEEKIEKFISSYGAPIMVGLGLFGVWLATSPRGRR